MHCAKCGAENPDGSKSCKNCGTALDQLAATQQAPKLTLAAMLAVGSVMLGFLSLFFGPLSILGIILGGVALKLTAKDPAHEGKGVAIAGLVVSIVMLVIWIILIVK